MMTRAVFALYSCLLTATAYAQATRVVHASVYVQSSNKLVTGLEQRNFAIVENGVLRAVDAIESTESAAIVVVGFDPSLRRQLVRTSSVAEALALLTQGTRRKAIVVAPGTDTSAVPADVHVVIDTDPEHGFLVANNAYVLRYSPRDPGAAVQVVLAEVDTLPPMRVEWQ